MGRVYSYKMNGSRNIFADECQKKHLLDLILTLQKGAGWRLYAFCVMDSCAWFIIESDRISVLTRHLQEETAAMLKTSCITGRIRKLYTLEEIAECSRMIHRLPYKEGRVEHLRDYWWSSYITYMGIYEWKQVNCRVLTLYFSADPLISRKKMEQYCRKETTFVF